MNTGLFVFAGVLSAVVAAILAHPYARAGRNEAAAVVVLGVLLASLSLYLVLGRPGLADAPLSGKAAGVAKLRNYTLLAQKPFEAITREDPGDLSALSTLADINMELGRKGEAVQFYKRAFDIALLRADPRARRIGEKLGVLQVSLARGRVTFDAWQTFNQLRKMDPDNALARDYLALYVRQGQ